MSTTDTIALARDGAVATLTMNRPDRHNALGLRELAELAARLREVDADTDTRVLILTGAGDRTFCAGFDLGQIGDANWDDHPFDRAMRAVESVRVPTVCALNGSVYGGGVELALACDFRIGVVGARVHLPAAELGVHYSLAGMRRIVSRLGLNTAKRLLLAAEPVSGDDLVRLGFVDRLVAPESLGAVARERADRIAGLAPLAVTGMKRALNGLAADAVDAAATDAAIRACFASADAAEGVAARRARRAPRFQGT
jgi:enoyl-CoA hydratase/carnithine racemase